MAADVLGARLLAEAEEDGLDELLSELRHLVYQPKSQLGFAPLDRLLEVFCAPLQAAPPTARWSSPDDADGHVGRYAQGDSPAWDSTVARNQGHKQKPVVVELTSSLPACGKTNFLYYLTAVAVLPDNYGGKGTAVVWLDTDGRFSAIRLREVMIGMLPSSGSQEDDAEKLVEEALLHVHVFRPQSSRQLVETLEYLSSYLLDASVHLSIQRRLGLLVLDSGTAFYWQDRFESENARFERPDEPQDKPSRTTEVIARLRKLQKEFCCAILFSTTSSFLAVNRLAQPLRSDTAAPQQPRSFSPWTAFATLTLRLSRVETTKFASHISLEECLRDQSRRQEAVAKGRFWAELDRGTSDSWTSDVREALRRTGAEGSFGISIATTVSP